ncbi:MAG: hypothetical protein GF405_08370 [Candidatus Eisenbacteria bacterium]|nr:hypothetical protein [Candidatus Eisenbacteria bacterium]
MRHRRWVIFVILVLILLPPMAVVSVRVASERPGFREAVLARILPESGAELSVGDLSLGLASLTMSDIVVDLGERGSLRVPRASVDVSIQKLLTSGFDVRRAVSSILIDSPRAELVIDAGDADSTAPAPSPRELDELIPDYVAVSDGELRLSSRSGGTLLLSSFDALASRDASGDVTGSFSGSLLGGKGNLTGDIVSGAAGLTVTLSVDEAALRPGLPLPRGMVLDVTDGVATVRASAAVDTSGFDLAVSGTLEEGLLEFERPEARLTGVSAEASYRSDTLTVGRFDGDLDGTAVALRGKADVARGRFAGFKVELDGVAIDRLLTLAGAESLEVRGVADATVVLDGPFDDAGAAAVVRRARGRARGVAFSELRAELAFRDGVLTVRELTSAALGGNLMLSGTADLDAGEVSLTGGAFGVDARELAELVGDVEADGSVDVRDLFARYEGGRLEGEALVAWGDLRVGELRPGAGAGGVVLADELLAATLESRSGDWRVTAEVEFVGAEPNVALSAALENFAVDSLAPLPPALSGTVLDGEAGLRGPADSLVLSGTLRALSPWFAADIDLDGEADLAGAERRLAAAFAAVPFEIRGFETELRGRLEINGDGGLGGWATVDRLGRVEAEVGPGPGRTLSAGLVVSEARLEDVFAVATGGVPPPGLAGFVFVSASASGTLERPVVTGQLEIADAVVGAVGDLSASGEVAIEGDSLRIEGLTVREGGNVFLRGAGSAVADGPLSFSIAGEGVPGQLLRGTERTRFDATVGIGGTTSDPTVDARLESEGGTFLGIPFDDLVARVTGARGTLTLDPLALERRNAYRLSAEGNMPLELLGEGEGDGEATLDITVDGDPIALLVEASGLGTSHGGRGSLHASLVGEPDEMVVANAEVDATATLVRPSEIIEELRDVSLELEIVDGAVVDGSVSGTIDGRTGTLESVRRRVVDGRILPPLDIGGVDAGVLALGTDGGVRVNIPGLMTEGEYGRLDVAGPAGGDHFYFTGPGSRATLLGQVEFSDLSFIYPFEDDDGDEDGGTNPIMDAEWAITMRAGRNVWYRRADADVKVEEGGSLEFRGSPDGGTLCVRGRLESTRGTVTYLNRDFDLRTAFVDFPFFCEPPRFFVEAETRVEDGTTVTLTMDSYEPALTFAGTGATLDESAITLASDAPEDDSEEEILSRLQYGMGFALLEGEEQAALERRQALDVVGGQLSMRVVRPILAPVETRIRRNLNLDLVRIDVDFVEHFLSQLDLWRAQEGSAQYLPFLVRSRITLGKYLSRDWLMSYVGTTRAYQDDVAEQSLGLRHELGIEYEVSRNTSLSMRVVYDPVIQDWDRRLSIENRYEF